MYPQALLVFFNETLFKTVIHLRKAHINSNSFHFVLVQTTQQVYDLDVVLVTNRSSHSTLNATNSSPKQSRNHWVQNMRKQNAYVVDKERIYHIPLVIVSMAHGLENTTRVCHTPALP